MAASSMNKPSSPASICRISQVLDYRAPDDDAWYAVRVQIDSDGGLRVMYCDFDECYDEWYYASSFVSLADVDGFRDRFRVASRQLQDNECRQLVEGMLVCASHSSGADDLLFFDAIIESISCSTHKPKDECSCRFQVLWQHGPQAGKRTVVGIENICVPLIRRSSIDPVLDGFLKQSRKMVKEKVKDNPSLIAKQLR